MLSLNDCDYDNDASCHNLPGSFECRCPMGLQGGAIVSDPCYEPPSCYAHEVENYCVNQECFHTCETTLNYLDPICNTELNFTMRSSRADCMAGCVCSWGYVREELNNKAWI